MKPPTLRILALLLPILPLTLAADLKDRITTAVESAPAAVRGTFGIHVVDLSTATPVYTHKENQLLLPASNMKLFTAALALTRLGPDYRFETRLLREPSGAIVLLGSGDPSLSGRIYPLLADVRADASDDAPTRSPLEAIDDLADQAVAAGLRRVDGDVIGDDGRYPWSPYPESWTADDVEHDFGGAVSALTLNDSSITLILRPGARPNDLARVEVSPPVEYFTIDNRISTSTSPTKIRIQRVPGTRQLLLTGVIRAGNTATRESIAVDDPALFAAHALYDALLRRGVVVRGRPVARHTSAAGSASLPEGQLLARRTSPPLSEILQTMMKASVNLHAELILREVGYVRQAEGTLAGGLKEMQTLLAGIKISAADWRTEDASGLARNDEITPRAITQLLTSMWANPEWRETWLSFLPVGGQDGTLSNRLCCSSETIRIRAKTGTLARAVTLSGYAESPRNGRLAFSILVNNFSAPPAEVQAWVDRIATALIE
ncbi:MAG: D-alanyl-D-alanine carboxypeptidase/D-alanyl-D-alanine-endopeptidase [Acidobacteriota bacterium]